MPVAAGEKKPAAASYEQLDMSDKPSLTELAAASDEQLDMSDKPSLTEPAAASDVQLDMSDKTSLTEPAAASYEGLAMSEKPSLTFACVSDTHGAHRSKDFKIPEAAASCEQLAVSGEPSLTLACVSYTHGAHQSEYFRIPEADVLLFAGDAGMDSGGSKAAFDAWLSSIPHKHKIVTLGNMDTFINEGPGNAEAEGCIQLKHGTVVCDSIVEVDGYRIFASPWTPAFFGAYQLQSEEEARAHWSKVLPPNSKNDILMTHGPPHGVGDTANGRHVGDKELLRAVQALETPPLLWVCGHIHGSYGQHVVPHPALGDGKGITLINAAIQYVYQGHTGASPRVVQLPSGAVTQPHAS
eukprot:gene7425-558_t